MAVGTNHLTFFNFDFDSSPGILLANHNGYFSHLFAAYMIEVHDIMSKFASTVGAGPILNLSYEGT